MTDLLDQLAQSSVYHYDMLVLLNEMKKLPLGLTKTGQLQRIEIAKLGSLFKHDMYHRDQQGEIIFPIVREDQLRYLLSLRALAKIMYLSYQRKGKVHLSKNGLGFLENISPGIQLTHLFLTFVHQLDWAYLQPGRSNGKNVSRVLQENANDIFHYLLDSNTDSFDLKLFSRHLGERFDLIDPEEMKDASGDQIWWVKLSIEYTLIRELEFFGVVMTQKIRKDSTSDEIVEFTLTDGGRLLLTRVFEQQWGY